MTSSDAVYAMRDRLLRAVDDQSNICNMMVVVEVLSFLEKYPIAKETLEETRLGRVINDIRKKTKNGELAKRAKKLLRKWQNLIEPEAGSSSGKAGPEPRSHLNNCSSKVAPSSRKHRPKEGNTSYKVIFDEIQNSNQQPSNGSIKSAKTSKNVHARHCFETERFGFQHCSQSSNPPQQAVKPHLSAPCTLRAPNRRQQGGAEHMGSGGLLHTGHLRNSGSVEQESHHCTLGSPADTSSKRRVGHKVRGYGINLNPSVFEVAAAPVGLKDRSITFDPITRQIKPSCLKTFVQREGLTQPERPPPALSEPPKQNQPGPVSPCLQTDWKERSSSEVIPFYLSQQCGSARLQMEEFLRKEDAQKMCEQSADGLSRALPGLSAEICQEHLHRLHSTRWCGVNGCYDTKGAWYGWTEGFSVAPHGDGGRLDIMPYVCLDWLCSGVSPEAAPQVPHRVYQGLRPKGGHTLGWSTASN